MSEQRIELLSRKTPKAIAEYIDKFIDERRYYNLLVAFMNPCASDCNCRARFNPGVYVTPYILNFNSRGYLTFVDAYHGVNIKEKIVGPVLNHIFGPKFFSEKQMSRYDPKDRYRNFNKFCWKNLDLGLHYMSWRATDHQLAYKETQVQYYDPFKEQHVTTYIPSCDCTPYGECDICPTMELNLLVFIRSIIPFAQSLPLVDNTPDKIDLAKFFA